MSADKFDHDTESCLRGALDRHARQQVPDDRMPPPIDWDQPVRTVTSPASPHRRRTLAWTVPLVAAAAVVGIVAVTATSLTGSQPEAPAAPTSRTIAEDSPSTGSASSGDAETSAGPESTNSHRTTTTERSSSHTTAPTTAARTTTAASTAASEEPAAVGNGGGVGGDQEGEATSPDAAPDTSTLGQDDGEQPTTDGSPRTVAFGDATLYIPVGWHYSDESSYLPSTADRAVFCGIGSSACNLAVQSLADQAAQGLVDPDVPGGSTGATDTCVDPYPDAPTPELVTSEPTDFGGRAGQLRIWDLTEPGTSPGFCAQIVVPDSPAYLLTFITPDDPDHRLAPLKEIAAKSILPAADRPGGAAAGAGSSGAGSSGAGPSGAGSSGAGSSGAGSSGAGSSGAQSSAEGGSGDGGDQGGPATFKGATVALPAGWTAEQAGDSLCLAAADRSCAIRLSTVESRPDSGQFVSYEASDGYTIEGAQGSCASSSLDAADTLSFGGRPAEFRSWTDCGAGGQFRAQYMTPTTPAFLISTSSPEYLGAMREITEKSGLPAESSSVRLYDQGIVRAASFGADGARIELDRTFGQLGAPINNNPAIYSYELPLDTVDAVTEESIIGLGVAIAFSPDGAVLRVLIHS